MLKKLAYIGAGVILLAACIATGTYGLSQKNIDIYKKALGIQDEMQKKTFAEFHLEDYPISFYDGNKDYVVTGSMDSYTIKTRKPVLPTFVGTAYKVEDHYEILVPAIEKFSSMFALLDSAEKVSELSEGNDISFEETEYGENEQAATIWHEGFHAYQMSIYEDNITACLKGHSFDDADFNEQLIVKEVDKNASLQTLYEKELSLLKKMVVEDNVDEIKEDIIRYRACDEARKEKLSENVQILEEYYERVEGSAFYMESTAYGEMVSNEACQSHYIASIDEYRDGSAKYYYAGMAKCRILDKIAKDWKDTYEFDKSLTELLYEAAER